MDFKRTDPLNPAAQRAQRLQVVAAALAGAVTAEEVAGVIVGEALSETGASSGGVYLLRADRRDPGILRRVDCRPEPAEACCVIPFDTSPPATDAVRHGEPVFAETGEESGGEGAVAALPLPSPGRIAGALVLRYSGPHRFSGEERAFLRTVANLGALALERTRLYSETERERRAAAILENIADVFFSLDREGRFTYVNRACERHFGKSRQDLIGHVIWEVFPQTRGSVFEENSRRMLQEQTPEHFEGFSPIVGRWVEVHSYPSPEGISVYFRDISERKESERLLAENEARQRAFLREVLASVTQGHFCLCESPADLPPRRTPFGEPIALSASTLRQVRRRAEEAASAQDLPEERTQDLITSLAEAGMNVVVHGGGGRAAIHADEGVVQVWIEDSGGGIDMHSLPRATMQRGFSTAGTLGHGFWLIIQTCDAAWLLTGPEGTTVVLEQGRTAPPPAWLLGR